MEQACQQYHYSNPCVRSLPVCISVTYCTGCGDSWGIKARLIVVLKIKRDGYMGAIWWRGGNTCLLYLVAIVIRMRALLVTEQACYLLGPEASKPTVEAE
jgi:hypothetical protein